MLRLGHKKPIDTFSDIPQKLLDIELPIGMLVKLSHHLDFSKEEWNCFEKHILTGLACILRSNDLAATQRRYVCYFIDGIIPLQ
jgi:hypothetical protein